jgi:hypothetical protein
LVCGLGRIDETAEINEFFRVALVSSGIIHPVTNVEKVSVMMKSF